MISKLIALVLIGQLDAGTVEITPIYKVGEDARITEGDHAPVDVPPGYYFPMPAFTKIDNEMRRLQYVEKHPPQPEPVGADGFVIAVIVGLVAGSLLGAGLTFAALRK